MHIQCQEATLEGDDEIDDSPIIRLMTKAEECQRPALTSPCSVFDLAGKEYGPRRVSKAKPKGAQSHTGRIDMEYGITRVAGAAYPSREVRDFDE